MRTKHIIFLSILLACTACTRRSNNFQNTNSNTPQMTRTEQISVPQEPIRVRQQTSSTMGGSEIFDQYNSAVFMILTSDGRNEFQGSGFFINSSGLAVSNYHVFEGTGIGLETIQLSNGARYKIKEVVAKNRDYDFIIFKVDISSACNYIPISSRPYKVGEKVFAIGSPRGLENTFSSGEISQLRGNYVIQINVPIDHGSSGGALINEYGEAMGITSAGYDDSGANLNFAIDIDAIKPYINTTSSNVWTQSELHAANTAYNVEDLTQNEKEVIKFLNLARMFPQRFLQIELMNHNNVILYENSTYLSSLKEELDNLNSLSAFYYDSDMQLYAECWAIQSGNHGLIGHNRKGYCNDGYFAECCSYGHKTAKDIVIGLLVDFNVPSLGHRKILLGNYRGVGVSIASHNSEYHTCCVIDLSI